MISKEIEMPDIINPRHEHYWEHGRNFYQEIEKFSYHMYMHNFLRYLNYHDLYMKVADIPGAIFEFGVLNGGLFYYFAKHLEAYHYCTGPEERSDKKLVGFDTLEGFPNLAVQDVSSTSCSRLKLGGMATRNKDIFLSELDYYRAVAKVGSRIEFVIGDIAETLPAYLEKNPGIRASMIVVDVDVYSPTKKILECMWPRLSRQGVLVFDEYGLNEYPGEAIAADEFLQDKDVVLRRFPHTTWSMSYCFRP